MPLGLLRNFIVLCLGRQEPEGGVVLGLHLIIYILCLLYLKYKYYITLHMFIIMYASAIWYSFKCRYCRITIGILSISVATQNVVLALSRSILIEHESSLYLTSQ